MLYLLLFGALGAALYAFAKRQSHFDKDRDQHHLASMMIAHVTGSDEIGLEQLVEWLDGKGWPPLERQKRIDHAVKLAGTAVTGEVFDQVTRLARQLNFGAEA